MLSLVISVPIEESVGVSIVVAVNSVTDASVIVPGVTEVIGVESTIAVLIVVVPEVVSSVVSGLRVLISGVVVISVMVN